MHMHDCAELWYALSGEAIHKVGEVTFHQTPGMCIIIPAFVAHTISTEHSEDTPVFLRANVDDDAIRQLGYDYFSYNRNGVYFKDGLLPIYHRFSNRKLEIANDIAHRISDEYSKHKKLNINKMLNLYIDFISLLEREKTSFKLKPSLLERTNLILAAADYLYFHYSEAITIDELCKLTSMSRSSFSDHFTKITGVSPMYYLKCIRMNVARVEFMLRGKGLTEIAELTGLYGKAQLSRMFKEHFGESFSEATRKRQQRELLADRETRQRYAVLNELGEFFKNQTKQ